MCAIVNDENVKYTKTRLQRLRRDGVKYIWGWKSTNSMDGISEYYDYQYGPGTHKLENKNNVNEYETEDERGFHFFLTKKAALYDATYVFRVRVPVSQIFLLEKPVPKGWFDGRQGVSNEIFISKADWKKAGFNE